MTGTADPRCPECGGAIGATATYCMHCSADLTDTREAADADGDETWDSIDGEGADAATATASESAATATAAESNATPETATETAASDQLLDPDGLVDNTLTVIVGIVGGTIAGLVGTVVLGLVTTSGYGVLFGVVVWLVVTAYLVRQRTVQGAVSRSGYAIALVLLVAPLLSFSPAIEPEGGSRGGLFVVLLVFSIIPAGLAGAVGWVASQFVPEDPSDGSGGDGGDTSAQ